MKKELILEIIQERWSPYSFTSSPIEDFRLKAMFEAAGHAPSSRNEQPWIFVYATRHDEKEFSEYLEFLDDSNKVWARNAYALVVTMARTRFALNGKPNRYALFDTGMAVAKLLLQALAFDIYCHQMGGFSEEKVISYFRLNDDIIPGTVMAIGYLGEGASLPPEVYKKDETRRPRKHVYEIAFRKSFANPAFKT